MITQTIRILQKHWIRLILAINFTAISLLAGCTTAGNAIPQGGPTMAQVYEEAMQKSNGQTLDQVRGQIRSPVAYNGITELSDYTRTSENEINNLFPTLPNPQLVIYVYPHLAGQDETPVPGYSTVFSLFKEEHFL